MNKTAHIVGGTCAGIMTSAVLINSYSNVSDFIVSGILIGSSVWGALLPDIDHPESTIGKKSKLVSKIISATGGHRGITHAPLIYLLLVFLLMLFNKKPIQIAVVIGLEYFLTEIITIGIYKLKLVKKPYILHFVLFVILAIYTLKSNKYIGILYTQMIIGMFVGAISHIFLDSLTKSGTPWFYPIIKRKFRLLKLRTGKDDWLGIVISIVITIIFVFITKLK